MKQTYLALLRGINVGGKNMVKMADLVVTLEQAGYGNVRTYIQSGNVLFTSTETDSVKLARQIERAIEKHFQVPVGVAVFSREAWEGIIKRAPKDWGIDKTWKHNLLAMLQPYDMGEAVKAIGELKPGIETIVPGDGVLYQSISLDMFGRTTSGKLASNPIYQRMTIRNYNTATKLLTLLQADQ